MIRRSGEKRVETRKMFNGEGQARMRLILESNAEMYDKGRVFNHLYLEPGCEVGWHVHHGDGETYLILKGLGLYNDNGITREVVPGDVTFVDDGEGHALKCISDEPLEAIALILYK